MQKKILSYNSMSKIVGLIIFLASGMLISATTQTLDYTRWVNPFIGTGGHGHTFPGSVMPFGMVQLSPDTRIDNWDGSSGYHYSDDVIYGFSHTHLSGTGIPDGADILIMPTLTDPEMPKDPTSVTDGRYHQKFSHTSERAEPGFYTVRLDDDIEVELTATKRVGFHRYRFPSGKSQRVILDLQWRDRVISHKMNSVSGTRIEGLRRSSSWAKDQTVYFVADFYKPFNSIQFDRNPVTDPEAETPYFVLGFQEDRGEELLIKVAISYVSIEGARKNLEAELLHWDFDKVRADAKAAWNKELSKIEVSGGTDDQTSIFYTALYHTMIHPSLFNDVDGRYKGHDGKIHQLPGYGVSSPTVREDALQKSAHEQGRNRYATKNPPANAGGSDTEHYTVFSLWDTFRATHPLYTIIDQKRTVDFINTFIRIYEQGGRLPVWELWGEETDTMIGYHAVSVIADAMTKGIKGFDYEKAYAAAKHSAELDHFGLAAYKRRGYISSEDENESVSKTLEYAYNDWCLFKMAIALVEQYSPNTKQFEEAAKKYFPEANGYLTRARYYENLFDPATGFMRPKRNGGFVKPFAPNEVTFHFTEGNSWQYSFFVPHDVPGLISLIGGRKRFASKLDELFTTDQKLTGRFQPDITGLIGQYAHGNEPSHHIPYLYRYTNQPWKTQKYVRKIMDEFYKNAPDGLIGNEDAGQMSAWYVLNASGFYPVAPGEDEYVLGTPLFKEIKYNLENGKTFIIKAPDVSKKRIYIKSMKLNRMLEPAHRLSHFDLMKGSVLELEMSDKPQLVDDLDDSNSQNEYLSAAVPLIEGDRVFEDATTVLISSILENSKIYFTVDGTEPTTGSTLYSKPFTINSATTVKAFVVSTYSYLRENSKVTEAVFHKRPNDWKVLSTSGYSTQYTGGGDDAVIDGLRGNANFASGEWQGYHGKTFEAVIDLQRETEIRKVGGGFLQSARSWIWMPDRVEFEFSTDGMNFTRLAEIRPGFSQNEMNPVTRDFVQSVGRTKARYIRVRAHNLGKIPAWHPGAGGEPWIFVDEIIIN